MFLGEYLHTFDAKNRISLPSKFRKGLGRTLVVTRGLDHCLYVYSKKAWEKEARIYAADVNGSAARRGLARLFLAGSAEVDVDTTGRVLIPDHLKSFASIGEKAIVAGVADRVEIWEEGAWKAYTTAIERDADVLPRKSVIQNNMEARHDSVLMREILEVLAVQLSDTVVDATLGGAGHFSALLSALGEGGTIVGIDADLAAVERGREAYALDRRPERPVAHLVNDNFRNLARILERLGIGQINKALFDLGWSGYQIATPRGFSFQNDAPLLMTYGEGGETAADIVNGATEEELRDILFTYGEERFARSIARAIITARAKERILTTEGLVAAVMAGTPQWYRERKTHPATKTFQALRIAVNDEIGSLREGLTAAISALAPQGRLAVISFHSIEDRVVKNMLRDAAQAGLGTILLKKPIVPSRSEILQNRRARSAKLRVFERGVIIVPTEVSDAIPNQFSYA